MVDTSRPELSLASGQESKGSDIGTLIFVLLAAQAIDMMRGSLTSNHERTCAQSLVQMGMWGGMTGICKIAGQWIKLADSDECKCCVHLMIYEPIVAVVSYDLLQIASIDCGSSGKH